MSIVNNPVAFADPPEAYSISKASSADIISAIPAEDFFGNKVRYKGLFTNDDSNVDIGIFDMTVEEEANGKTRYEGFPVNEFMFFLEGTMTLIDDNGKVTKAGPGEVLFIPKGWVGTRITTSIRKVGVRFLEEPSQKEEGEK